jgi:hypothetical protein
MPSINTLAVTERNKLIDACRLVGPQLNGCVTHRRAPVDGALLLWAISGVESDFGRMHLFARHEPAYMPGGLYYKRSPLLRSLWQIYGVLASCSYGAFQVMYPTAYETGFRGHPVKLQAHDICGQAAADLILKRFVQTHGATTLEAVFDAYNTGTHRDTNVPVEYVAKATRFYDAGWPDQLAV